MRGTEGGSCDTLRKKKEQNEIRENLKEVECVLDKPEECKKAEKKAEKKQKKKKRLLEEFVLIYNEKNLSYKKYLNKFGVLVENEKKKLLSKNNGGTNEQQQQSPRNSTQPNSTPIHAPSVPKKTVPDNVQQEGASVSGPFLAGSAVIVSAILASSGICKSRTSPLTTCTCTPDS